MTFKVGDLAWSPFSGFQKIEPANESWACDIKHGVFGYYSDGRRSDIHPHPTLLTVEQAKLLGYEPPKVKKKITLPIHILTDGNWYQFFKHEGDANNGLAVRCPGPIRNQVVSTTIEIEVEE